MKEKRDKKVCSFVIVNDDVVGWDSVGLGLPLDAEGFYFSSLSLLSSPSSTGELNTNDDHRDSIVTLLALALVDALLVHEHDDCL